jgi:hypothetical protein
MINQAFQRSKKFTEMRKIKEKSTISMLKAFKKFKRMTF